MNWTFSPRRVLVILGLTAMWCGLWQAISFANVAGGLLLATLATGVGANPMGSVRIGPLLTLFWVIFVDLVSSTITVAKEVLTPSDNTEESIIAVQLPSHASDHMLLFVGAITLTPGTAVVDTDANNAVIYVHLLHDSGREGTVAHANRLAELVHAALPARSSGVSS